MKVPYMLIVGVQEVREQCVAVRERSGVQQQGVAVSAFIQHVQAVIHGRSPHL